MDDTQHRVSQSLEKIGPVYSTKDEKQRLIAEEVLALRFKPKLSINVNQNIQGLDKKRVIGGKNSSYLRMFYKLTGKSKNGVIYSTIHTNIAKFGVPFFVFLFYYYIASSFTLSTYYKLEKNNMEIDFCYRKLGTTSTHMGEKYSLMA